MEGGRPATLAYVLFRYPAIICFLPSSGLLRDNRGGLTPRSKLLGESFGALLALCHHVGCDVEPLEGEVGGFRVARPVFGGEAAHLHIHADSAACGGGL